MMTESLKQVVAEIEQLPADEQDVFAETLRLELEAREWNAIIAKPGSQRFLDHLVAEARRADAAGKTKESGDSW